MCDMAEPATPAMSFGDRMMMNARARRHQEEVHTRAWWPCQAWENWLQHAIADQQQQACDAVAAATHKKKLPSIPKELAPAVIIPEVDMCALVNPRFVFMIAFYRIYVCGLGRLGLIEKNDALLLSLAG